MRGAVFIGVSLDGFIARPGGEVDFLDSVGPVDSDMGFQAFMDSVDAMVMGRKTFETVMGFDVAWPYGTTPVIVLSSGTVEIPAELSGTVESSSLGLEALAGELSERGIDRVYVDGGQTIQKFLRAGLIDEIVITTVPILIGEGIPLFGALAGDLALRHIDTTAFANGMVQSTYHTSEESAGEASTRVVPDPG